ncbi:MAG: hypothetical protein WCA20_13185 [Candidatus Sulfotelmatobacter sp.]
MIQTIDDNHFLLLDFAQLVVPLVILASECAKEVPVDFRRKAEVRQQANAVAILINLDKQF